MRKKVRLENVPVESIFSDCGCSWLWNRACARPWGQGCGEWGVCVDSWPLPRLQSTLTEAEPVVQLSRAGAQRGKAGLH